MSVRKTSLVVVLGVLTLAAALVLSSGVLPAAAAPAKQATTPAPTLPRDDHGGRPRRGEG